MRNDESTVRSNRVSVGALAGYQLAGMGSVLHEGRSKLAKSRNMMATAIDQDSTVALAPRAGADLRAARERVGWSLPDVAAGLHIRLGYLEALEEGRIAALPGNAYALGFLRTYAKALGLDPNEITRRFKAEAATVTEKTELAFPMPVPERGVPAGAVVLLGVVLAVGAYVGWYRLSGEGKLPAETSTQIPTRLAPLAEQAVPPSAPPPATTAAAPTPVPTGPMQLVTVDPPPVPSVSPSSAAAAPLPPPVSASTDQPRIVLRANADAWVQVRDRSGPVLLNRILHAGDTWDVPAKANLLLTTGNAGGTDLVVDGVSSPSLGGNGAVRRDLPLDPDLIKDGKLSAATTQAGTPRSTTQ
jgi:cytoskeleton protein RodZ